MEKEFTTTWCFMLFNDPIQATTGDNILFHFKHVVVEIRCSNFGYKKTIGCSEYQINDWCSGHYDQNYKIQLTMSFEGDMCSHVIGMFRAFFKNNN